MENSQRDRSTMALADLEAELGVDGEGLTGAEAIERFARYGPNEVVEHRRGPLLILLGYFWGPIPWMIEVALALSLVTAHWADAAVIAVLLAMNGVVGFVEEYQAQSAVAALEHELARSARVRRDGAWTVLPVRELVPGDLTRVRLGDVVGADARLLSDGPIEVDQSALTGESLPVTRTGGGALYSGSVVTRGEADALVYATGASSYFGRTAALVGTAGTVSHFQRAVLQIGNYLIVIAVALVSLTLVVSLARGDPVLQTLEFALVVTIASVPVALPAVLSVTMAVGARELARRHAVVNHLPAVEELGGIDILCTDKTGTLTQNRLTVGEPWCTPGTSRAELLAAAAAASRAEDQDPIDLAVLATPGAATPSDWRVVSFTPFDPVTKRTEAEVRLSDARSVRVAKGAPQAIAALCPQDPSRASADSTAESFARRGFRSLAVARADGDGAWRLLGLLPLEDPPREDSASTIAEARRLGIEVKMVTGDQVAIGREIAREIGLGDHLLDAEVLQGDDERVADAVESADGFAQVFPEHKYRIVRLLQSRGHIVGMTGDGVNDAPALKQADAGIAVAGATEAARAAADVVLLTPGLSVIVRAVALARVIFGRMTSFALYRIAETVRVLLLVVVSVVAFNFFPVSATMIVLLAVLNDGAILTIAYDRVRGADRPAAWDMRTVLTVASVIGVVGLAETFLLLSLAVFAAHLPHAEVQTLIYLKLSVAGHLTIFVTRTRGPFWSRPAPARLLLAAVVGTKVLATAIAAAGLFMTALPGRWIVIAWGYALVWFVVNDRVKIATYRWLEAHPRTRAPATPASVRAGSGESHGAPGTAHP